MSQPAPGWYPDPAGSQRLRWWNGGEWTEQFHDTPQQEVSAGQQSPTDQGAGQHMPAQSQAPSVSSDAHNPAGAAPQLGIAETGSQHAGDSAPKNSPGWVIGAIVSALLVVVFFCTAVFAGMQLRAKNLELREAAEHETSAHNDLDRKQRELDKVKKDLEEIQK